MGVVSVANDALSCLASFENSNTATLTDRPGSLEEPYMTLFHSNLDSNRSPWNDSGIHGSLLGLDHAMDGEAANRAGLGNLPVARGFGGKKIASAPIRARSAEPVRELFAEFDRGQLPYRAALSAVKGLT